MYIFISVLILVVCILLGLIVLVQNPKGGGLAANFTGSTSQFMGVRQTADFLEKASWTLAVVLLVLSLTAALVVPRATTIDGQQESTLKDKIENTAQPAPVDFQTPPPSSDEEN
jgi:preprotein translocase subunit SecG